MEASRAAWGPTLLAVGSRARIKSMPIHVLFGWMIGRFCCVSGLELRAAVAGKGAPFLSPILEIAGQRAVPGPSRPFGESGEAAAHCFRSPDRGRSVWEGLLAGRMDSGLSPPELNGGLLCGRYSGKWIGWVRRPIVLAMLRTSVYEDWLFDTIVRDPHPPSIHSVGDIGEPGRDKPVRSTVSFVLSFLRKKVGRRFLWCGPDVRCSDS